MCEEMDVQLYEPALALSFMAQRGGTFMTEDDKQNAHRQAIAMRFIRDCGHGEYLQHLLLWMARTSIQKGSQMPSP